MGNTASSAAFCAAAQRYSYTSLRLEEVEWRGPGLVMARYRVLSEGFPLVRPGQFILFWVPGLEAIPLSPLYSDEETMVFLVKERGETTRSIVKEPPRFAGAIGPQGRPVEPRGQKIVVVAGGVGVASALPVARQASQGGSETLLIYGARSAAELAPIESYAGDSRIVYTTEDGSKGLKGTVLDALDGLGVSGFASIYAAGPNPMLCALHKWAQRHGVLDKLFLAPERIIRCGMGFCGKCSIPGTDLLLCRDGAYLAATSLTRWVEEGCPVN